ncbi:hypothetical protein ACFE04_018028 [Oxalis oulophora]
MSELSLADRATIANMSPEYCATMGFFPMDHVTLQYLKLTGRSDDTVAMIESYLRANKMFVDYNELDNHRNKLIQEFPPIPDNFLCFLSGLVSRYLSGPKKRRVHAQRGLKGGSDGARGANYLITEDKRKVYLGVKNTVLQILTPGGGGFCSV